MSSVRRLGITEVAFHLEQLAPTQHPTVRRGWGCLSKDPPYIEVGNRPYANGMDRAAHVLLVQSPASRTGPVAAHLRRAP